MRFSIIIPAHNAAGFIGRAIDSVTAQDFTDYELIVVADKCTDETAGIAAQRGAHVLHTTGGAPGIARNAGMDRARGDYWIFLDADDFLLIDSALRRISDAIDETDEPHLLHYGFMWGPMPVPSIQPTGSHWHHVWSRAWHRKAIGDTRMPPLPAGQDTVFTMGMMNKLGLTHGTYDFPLVQHVIDRPGSVTYTHRAKQRRGDMSMMSGLDDFIQEAMQSARTVTVPPTR